MAYTVHFPHQFLEDIWMWEHKGFADLEVTHEGARYRLSFVDPNNVRMGLESADPNSVTCFAEPGMVVVQKITEHHIRSAVDQLVERGFFDTQTPIGHRVLKQIDRAKPYFTRQITRELEGVTTQHVLEIWLPVMGEHGWLSAVTIDGLNLPEMSAMPGDDPLDALISALRFVRGWFDDVDGKFTFSVWKHGKLPANIDYELS